MNDAVNNASFFNGLDYFYIVIMLVSTILGFKKGFTRVFLSTCALFGSAFLGAFLTPHMKIVMLDYIENDYTASIIANCSSYLISLIGLSIIIAYISSCIQQTFLSDLDRSAGALLGIVRGLALPFIMCLTISIVGMKSNEYDIINDSRISTLMSKAIKDIMPSLSKTISAKRLKSVYKNFKQINDDMNTKLLLRKSTKGKEKLKQMIPSKERTASKGKALPRKQTITTGKEKSRQTISSKRANNH